jgi:mannitol/fructose-specific phosphotransferase system IIA component (Ntr-type)
MAETILKENLQPRNIRFGLKAKTKDEAIRELVAVIHASTPLRNVDAVTQAVLAREQMMTTSLENGLAIPHGKTDTVDRLYVAMAVLKDGLDFNSTDRQPVRIIMLLVSPTSRGGPHLRFMAEFARLLQSAALRKAILESTDPNRVYALLTGEEPGRP